VKIGPYTLDNRLALAPMAGVTDQPFRQLCRELGAGYVVTEMVSANPALRNTRKSVLRTRFDGEATPVAVQIAGSDPDWLAQAAQYNVSLGAEIIDINMGCPAKKVCRKLAGSALLSDEPLVAEILNAVVKAVDVPVTLKIRTGPTRDQRNGPHIARLAQDAGISALSVHGRSREDRFRGDAEYDTIREICQSVSIPVFANGDVTHPAQARQVLDYTGADGLMIGRGAQGNPWIFREINHYLESGELAPSPDDTEVLSVITRHLKRLHAFYGEDHGVRVARKHISWYLDGRPAAGELRKKLMRVTSAAEQMDLLERHFSRPREKAA
jgi:tRNA-dihydrouridine synthase B